MRILIIEDDKNLCQIMRAGLQDAGIDSDFCHDGETGLELLLHNCYDACCLDRMLPSMDGLTILKKARAAKVSAPVLMLTAMGGLDDKVDGLEAGADDYLAKPFAIKRKLKYWLCKARAFVCRLFSIRQFSTECYCS